MVYTPIFLGTMFLISNGVSGYKKNYLSNIWLRIWMVCFGLIIQASDIKYGGFKWRGLQNSSHYKKKSPSGILLTP